tara:strand:+ start:955 stop:1176 length:222 start_codon:yes stop_codon:yes gene_type:complete
MMWLEAGGILWIFGKKTGYMVMTSIAQHPSLWYILTYLGGYDGLFNNVDLCSVVRVSGSHYYWWVVRAGYVYW